METTRLYIPPRKRLETIWRVYDNVTNTICWQIVTDTPDRNAPYHAMLGTSLLLWPNGLAQQTTERAEAAPDIAEIMPRKR